MNRSMPQLPILADLESLQASIAAQGLDGWLLADWHGTNSIALRAAGLSRAHPTRRWFLWIPRAGAPQLLHPAIERSLFADLPVARREFSRWSHVEPALRDALQGCATIAMEYWPGGAIPSLSRVDAGTVDLVRGLGVEVQSSAELALECLSRWSAEETDGHRRAARGLTELLGDAFVTIARRLESSVPVYDFEIQQQLLLGMAQLGLVTGHPPIVASGSRTGQPHYAPDGDRPQRIERQEVVMIDLWARTESPAGGHADMTWMAYTGDRPPSEVEERFTQVIEARDVALLRISEAIGEGRRIKGFEVDRTVREYFARRGVAELFVHRTGHSLGVSDVHGDGTHLDDFESCDERPLIPGLAVTIEPGLYSDEFGIRSEIDVLVGDRSIEVTTPIQRGLLKLAEGDPDRAPEVFPTSPPDRSAEHDGG